MCYKWTSSLQCEQVCSSLTKRQALIIFKSCVDFHFFHTQKSTENLPWYIWKYFLFAKILRTTHENIQINLNMKIWKTALKTYTKRRKFRHLSANFVFLKQGIIYNNYYQFSSTLQPKIRHKTSQYQISQIILLQRNG